MTVSDNSTGLKNYLRLMLGTVTDALTTSRLSKRFRSTMYHQC